MGKASPHEYVLLASAMMVTRHHRPTVPSYHIHYIMSAKASLHITVASEHASVLAQNQWFAPQLSTSLEELPCVLAAVLLLLANP